MISSLYIYIYIELDPPYMRILCFSVISGLVTKLQTSLAALKLGLSTPWDAQVCLPAAYPSPRPSYRPINA